MDGFAATKAIRYDGKKKAGGMHACCMHLVSKKISCMHA